MDSVSPLTREIRESFQPKIVHLYSKLFTTGVQHGEEEPLPSEGFWREFFLLKPAKQKFSDMLEPLTADDILHIRQQTRNFVQTSISEIESDKEPQNEHAVDNLTAFLAAVLAKRYTNPSTDVIEVLAGLQTVDKIMSDLVNGLERIISKSESSSLRRKAVDCAIAIVSGSYQTSLVTYFIHKDFFHGLMKFVGNNPEAAPAVLSLLALLANYNKFEAQNIYQTRMEDFTNEDVMAKLVDGFANTCGDIRDSYTKVQDDTPQQWIIGSTLSYVPGLRSLTPEAKKPPAPTEDEAKALFNELPNAQAVVFLGAYSFVHANNIFASHLISTEKDDDLESPLAAYLSATSYLCHHAHRNSRVHNYVLLSLFTLRLLTSDPILFKRLSTTDSLTTKISVRLAHQRPPHLPYISTPRIPITAILDILTDTLSHNLRKRLSLPLYNTTLTTLHTILTHLSSSHTRLPHHWSYIWLSLLSLLRFLKTYHTDLLSTARLPEIQTQLLTPLTSTILFSLLHGDAFLPDPESYDDLFYKLLEISDILPKFRTAYGISTSTSSGTQPNKLRRATEGLISISQHYHSLLSTSANKKKNQHQSPKEVQKIIGEGHETFSEVVDNLSTTGSVSGRGGAGAGGQEEFGQYTRFREGEWKVELKKIVRAVVEDGRVVVLQ